MKICVIGGANMDITAASAGPFVAGDSNPGTVRTAPGGVGRNIAHNLSLLGNQTSLVTVFGNDGFGKMLRAHCRSVGIDLSLSQTVSGARNACFVSVGGPDGELLGGVADMAVTGLMTPEWLEERMDSINQFDAVVADTNLPADTLSALVACCEPPLYIDAVSSAKASRLRQALLTRGLHSERIFALKCNRLEAESLGLWGPDARDGAYASRVQRLYISLGSGGVLVREDDISEQLPSLPVTGIVNTTGAGDAMFAGIVHAGPDATALDAARFGLECARCSMLSHEAVNEDIKNLKYE